MLATKAECIERLRGQPTRRRCRPRSSSGSSSSCRTTSTTATSSASTTTRPCRGPRDLYEAIARRLHRCRAARPRRTTSSSSVARRCSPPTAGELTARQIAIRGAVTPARLREVLAPGAAEVPPRLDDLRRRPARPRTAACAASGRAAASSPAGRACAASCPRSPSVQRGDILVTVATDPGWTTVFSIIGGVVVETGGVVAHAVMISREYGLPCVANLERGLRSDPRRRHHHRRRHSRPRDDPRCRSERRQQGVSDDGRVRPPRSGDEA